MRHHLSWISWAAILAAILLLLAPRSAHGQPAILSVETHRGKDTLYVGERAFISFDVDGQGAPIRGLVYPLEFSFGAGTLIGSMPDDVRMYFLPRFSGPGSPNVLDSLAGTDPDTLLMGLLSFGGPWVTQGRESACLAFFQPKAAGQIRIDSTFLPPANHLTALDPAGQDFAIEWHSGVIHLLPCPTVLGDVNEDGKVTAADVILFARCIFLCGSGIWPILDLGDVNCSGTATSKDAILLVNYVFKSTALPFCCNVLD